MGLDGGGKWWGAGGLVEDDNGLGRKGRDGYKVVVGKGLEDAG